MENCVFSSPWSQQKFLDSFQNSSVSMRLISYDDQIAGYLITLNSIDFIDILTIAITPQFQRKGLGRELLDDLLQRLDKNKVRSIMLEVRVSNVSAIHFYQKYGFE
ncbi:ribosomal protein S18-alanine N-acetyltransferase, partial [Candidatus Thioglobus sp.]|nr:ribosomal protein S18-alanine N-acetyltransferase [Candidatus Thioglobus sp.]